MSPFIAELVGTALLLLMGCGVVADLTLNKTKATGFNWLANTTAWALGVFISVTVEMTFSIRNSNFLWLLILQNNYLSD